MSEPQGVLPQVPWFLSQCLTSYKAMQFGCRNFTEILSCAFAETGPSLNPQCQSEMGIQHLLARWLKVMSGRPLP